MAALSLSLSTWYVTVRFWPADSVGRDRKRLDDEVGRAGDGGEHDVGGTNDRLEDRKARRYSRR